jgi:hypothetical protein
MTSNPNNSTQPLDSRGNLNMVEFELENIFQLINPRDEFRNNLKIDLLTYPNWKILLPRFLRYGFLIIAGIASGAIIILTGIRTVFTLIGAIKIFRQEKTLNHEGNKKSLRSQVVTS